jgi:cytochrome oxidase Cu insertion factor (SCO1/SenC/PrrC family)
MWLVLAAMVCLQIVTPQIVSAQNQAQAKPEPAPLKLKVGDEAPDFKLQYFDGSGLKDVTLSQYRGKSNVVLAFYVFAFTGG